MMTIPIAATFLAGLLLFPSSVFALRCGSKLVDIGDRKIEIVQKCGEPTLIEKWKVKNTTLTAKRNKIHLADIITDLEAHQEVTTEIMEEWTYNFGANRFIHFLTFSNGKLTRIELGSKGFAGEFPTNFGKARCGQFVETGDRKIDVIMKCGEPDFTENRMEERISSKSLSEQVDDEVRSIDEEKGDDIGDKEIDIKQSIRFQEEKVFVTIVEWSYNFGPRHFLQFITFRNGKVIKIEHGDYGYE